MRGSISETRGTPSSLVLRYLQLREKTVMMQHSDDLHRLGLKLKFVYSIVGLLVGLSCIIAGVVLGVNGVVGHTSWTASLLGLSTTMNDAAPGVIVFVVGIFMVLITRFRVREIREKFPEPASKPKEQSVWQNEKESVSQDVESGRSYGGRTVIDYHTGGDPGPGGQFPGPGGQF